MLQKSTIQLKHLLQTLPNTKEVLDFQKIANTNFPIVLLMTERGSKGKTVNSKFHVMKKFIETGLPSIYLQNTVTQIDKSKDEFFKDLNKPLVREYFNNNGISNEWLDELQFKGKTQDNTLRLMYKDQVVFKFLSLNHAELMKGSRVQYYSVVYDEFNVNANRVPNFLYQIDSLLHSLEDLVSSHNAKQELKLFIFGNSKSLANPFIYRMGVTHIIDEITELRDEHNNPLLLVVSPIFTETQVQQIEKENKQNWIFQLSKQLGTANHSYFNQTQEDETNNIVRWTEEPNWTEELLVISSFHHKGNYFNVFKNRSKPSNFHIVQVDTKQDTLGRIFCFKKIDITDNVPLHITLRNNLIRVLESDNATFENITTRINTISALVK